MEEKKYYFIDPRQHPDRNDYDDWQWQQFAEENGEYFCLTEKEFEEHENDEYLEYFVYRII